MSRTKCEDKMYWWELKEPFLSYRKEEVFPETTWNEDTVSIVETKSKVQSFSQILEMSLTFSIFIETLKNWFDFCQFFSSPFLNEKK